MSREVSSSSSALQSRTHSSVPPCSSHVRGQCDSIPHVYAGGPQSHDVNGTSVNAILNVEESAKASSHSRATFARRGCGQCTSGSSGFVLQQSSNSQSSHSGSDTGLDDHVFNTLLPMRSMSITLQRLMAIRANHPGSDECGFLCSLATASIGHSSFFEAHRLGIAGNVHDDRAERKPLAVAPIGHSSLGEDTIVADLVCSRHSLSRCQISRVDNLSRRGAKITSHVDSCTLFRSIPTPGLYIRRGNYHARHWICLPCLSM